MSELITDNELIKNKLDDFIKSTELSSFFEKEKNDLAIITLSPHSSKSIVMEYADAVAFMKLFHKSEELDVSYNNEMTIPKVHSFNEITIKTLNVVKFRRIKIAHHLNIDLRAMNTLLDGEEDRPF